MQCYFVTGTDTDVGKTVATVLLLKSLNSLGKSTLGIKPISAGCEQTIDGLRNEDALKLQAALRLIISLLIQSPMRHLSPRILLQKSKMKK